MNTKGTIALAMLAYATIIVCGCKKGSVLPSDSVATVNIVDALPTSLPMIPVQGTTGPIYTYKVTSLPQYGQFQNFKQAPTISYGNTYLINPAAGVLQLYLVQNNSDTLVTNGHVSKYMFNQQLNLAASNMYSLFITGRDTTSADYLMINDQLPIHPDSTCGVRFINLSTGSNPVSVDIKGQPNGSEVQSLAYKNYSDFRSYAATSKISSYIYEFRDASSGALLASYTLSGVNNDTNVNGAVNTIRFHNMTICLIGQPGGSGANVQKVILVNNY